MPRIVVLADTHVPARARDLPGPVWTALDALGPGDLVVHAGDWVGVELLDRMAARLGTAGVALLACWGNNDGPLLRARLPEVGRAELAGLRFAVVHETGAAAGRDRRMAAAFGPDTDVLVFGHSHIPWDSTVPVDAGPVDAGPVDAGPARELRLLNPGSPTDRRRQPAATFLTAGVEAGRLVEVELHRLPVRPAVGPGEEPAVVLRGDAHPLSAP